ncbi:MAG: amidase family protein [Acidimicrobiia bacterium]
MSDDFLTSPSDMLDGLDGLGLAAAIRAGDLSSAEAVDAAIARLDERNPALNVLVAERFDEARDEARGHLPDGPFAGVPFLVKALGANVAGLPTTRGSRLWADDVQVADSVAVARFRAAGLVVLGMTNTPELGRNGTTEPLLHGPAHNPRGLGYSTGGSSGGSAAAVASGIVPVAHANDGGGSIRIPASANGLFGLKPSRGRVPNAPSVDSLAYPVACNHAVTRTVRDSAALLDAISGPTVGDMFAAPTPARPFLDEVGAPTGRLRVAFTTDTAKGDSADPELCDAVRRMAALCEELGHDVVEAEFTYDTELHGNAMNAIMGVSVAVPVKRRLAELGRDLRDDDLEPFTRILFDMANGRTAVEYYMALQDAERVTRDIAPFFETYDVLLTPTMQMVVPPHGLADTSKPETMVNAAKFASFTGIFNLTGQPAVSIPFGTDERGLPIGVQFAARYGAEDLLIRLSSQIEEAAPWQLTAPWPPPGS